MAPAKTTPHFLITLLLFTILSIISAKEECKDINAYSSFELAPHYKNFLQDFTPVDEEHVLFVNQWEEKEKDKVIPKGTDLLYSNFRFNPLFGKDKPVTIINKDTKNSEKYYIYALSNIARIPKAATTILSDNNQIHVVEETPKVALAITEKDAEEHTKVHLSFLDISKVEYQKEFPALSYTFKNPWDTERVYDANGNVIGVVPTNSTITTGGKNQIALKMLKSQGGNSTATDLDLLLLIYADGSLKLVKYAVSGAAVTPKQYVILMPKVNVKNIEEGFLGVVGDSIYVSVPVHKTQVEALKKQHNKPVDFKPGQEQAPAIMKLKTSDLTLESISIVSVEQAANVTEPKLYAVALDVSNDGKSAVVIGNTNFDESPGESQKAFYGRFKSGESVKSSYLTGVGEEEKVSFIARSVGFSPDDSHDKLIVGGHIRGFEDFRFDGMLSYFSIAENKGISTLDVGEGRSNSIHFIKRFSDEKNHDITFIGLYLKGPESKDDINQYVELGFWQINCDLPSEAVEQGLKISFYVIFGVTTVITFVVFTYYVVMCFVKRDGATKGEKEKLLK
jgi:hypothetical protein